MQLIDKKATINERNLLIFIFFGDRIIDEKSINKKKASSFLLSSQTGHTWDRKCARRPILGDAGHVSGRLCARTLPGANPTGPQWVGRKSAACFS